MAMNYTTLIADKSTIGSIASWVNYSKLQPTVIVDEAQTLLWSLLRIREMMTDMRFSLVLGSSQIALPTGFLDPIGDIQLSSIGTSLRHKDGNSIQRGRAYTNTSGTLGTNPFTTVLGSVSVTVALAGHGLSQGSIFNTSGATAVGGVTIDGTFPISAVASNGNSFTLDITSLGSVPTSSATGGGSAVAYFCDNLTQGMPVFWGIWNEMIYFDTAINQQSLGVLQYYQSLTPLSTDNETNVLTARYPHLLRTACEAAAANFMKDTEEYNKDVARLTALVDRTNVENDGVMRGMDLSPIIP